MTQIKAPRGPDIRDSAYDVDPDFWREHSHISLQPVAAPSILGLYGFAGATFIVASNLAGWWDNGTSAQYLFPFAAFVTVSNPHLGRTKGDGQFRSRPGPTATAPPLHRGAVER
jgi:hypothetical protein